MIAVPILNPEVRKQACCGYGDWFALDLLIELWRTHPSRYEACRLTKICPSCGTLVHVDWKTETVIFGELKAEE